VQVSILFTAYSHSSEKKGKERNRGLESFTKEGSNRHRVNPDGREQVRKGRKGCSDERRQRRRDLRGNANSAGPVIHRRLYQNLITSEAKAQRRKRKEGEKKRERENRNTLELSHPRKAGNAEGWRWLYIPLDHPCLAVDDPPLGSLDSHTGYSALRVPLDVCICARISARIHIWFYAFTR